MIDLTNMESVEFGQIIIRVALALVFGFMLGYERDRKNKPMDFRAYMIVAATTCLMAIMGLELYHDYGSAGGGIMRLDLARIIAGALTGIGFLGAGAIIKVGNGNDHRAHIVGTATGASVWAAGGIGLCLGFGMYLLALVGFIAVALTLVIGGVFIPRVSGHGDKEDDGFIDKD